MNTKISRFLEDLMGTVSTLTAFSTEMSSRGWSWACEHTERLSQAPGQQRSYHGLCWRRVRSKIGISCASGSVWTVWILDFENTGSDKVQEKAFDPIINLSDKSKGKTWSCSMFNEVLLSMGEKKPKQTNKKLVRVISKSKISKGQVLRQVFIIQFCVTKKRCFISALRQGLWFPLFLSSPCWAARALSSIRHCPWQSPPWHPGTAEGREKKKVQNTERCPKRFWRSTSMSVCCINPNICERSSNTVWA